MRITHTRDRSNSNYFLEKPLKDVANFKDLGIAITKGLSWGNLISIIVNKADEVLGSIKRSIGTANVNVFSLCTNPLYTQFWSMQHLFGVLTLLRTSIPLRISSDEPQDLH